LVESCYLANLIPLPIFRNSNNLFDSFDSFVVGDIDGETNWDGVFNGVDTVVHCAAIISGGALNDFRRCNLFGTLQLAQHALDAGVKRFIFLSSIKVHGEYTDDGIPVTEESPFIPTDFYSQSKIDAELSLIDFLKNTSMEFVIIRPPLVYGPNCKGNFHKLSNLIRSGFPLPFGAIKNKRSYIALDNLVDFLLLCADWSRSPKAANQIFVVSDGEDISTSDLLFIMARASNCPSHLFRFPVILLQFLIGFFYGRSVMRSIFFNMQINCRKSHILLGWSPKTTMMQQLKKIFSERV
jgi:nucleoside-diphosphate-sugar epimerase